MYIRYENLQSHNLSANVLYDPSVLTAHTVFIVISMAFIPVILVANFLVFWATILCYRFHTAINLLLLSLSIADINTGLFNLPLYNIYYIESTRPVVLNNKYVCLTMFATNWISTVASLIHLVLIAAEKYIAVMWPNHHQRMLTVKKTIALIIIVWIYIIIVGFLPMMGYNNYDDRLKDFRRCNYYTTLPHFYASYLTMGTIYTCIIIPAILYVHIYLVFSRQMKAFRAHYYIMSRTQIRQFKIRESNVRMTIALMFAFIVLWMPYLLIVPLSYAHWLAPTNFEIWKIAAHMCIVVNALINMPIYALGRNDYKRAFWLLLTTLPCKWKKQLRDLRYQSGSLSTTGPTFARLTMHVTTVLPEQTDV